MKIKAICNACKVCRRCISWPAWCIACWSSLSSAKLNRTYFVDTNTWYHIAVTVTIDAIAVYVNGNSVYVMDVSLGVNALHHRSGKNRCSTNESVSRYFTFCNPGTFRFRSLLSLLPGIGDPFKIGSDPGDLNEDSLIGNALAGPYRPHSSVTRVRCLQATWTKWCYGTKLYHL